MELVKCISTSMDGDTNSSELVGGALRGAMEQFQLRISTQQEQLTTISLQMKSSLRACLSHLRKTSSKIKALEALVSGSGEELKIAYCNLKHAKIEKQKIEQEKNEIEQNIIKLSEDTENGYMEIEALAKKIEFIQQLRQERQNNFPLELKTLKAESQHKMELTTSQLRESEKSWEDIKISLSNKEGISRDKRRHSKRLFIIQIQALKDLKRSIQENVKEFLKIQKEDMEILGKHLHAMVFAARNYKKVTAENRQLYNDLQDLKGNIRVYCRVRPFLPCQVGRKSLVEFIGINGEITIVNAKKQGKDLYKEFVFNKVFGPSVSQGEIFTDTQPLIRSVLDGYNVCIFAYGQTGSGKTYTMSGPNTICEEDWGVNYRTLNNLFQISRNRESIVRYKVSIQMVEIYNEQIRDLLAADGASKKLEIRNSSQHRGLNLPDATMLPVNCMSDVLEFMSIGEKNRAVGATAMNERSSRSHSVLSVHVQGADLVSGSMVRGCLHLIDLAGSERVAKSEVIGERLREAQHINKSLAALGDVISALAQKRGHIPYRNSKLTQLLQDSLGGKAKTLMFVHINPDADFFTETLSTLKFAERVATVELGNVSTNKESVELQDLKDQVAMLKETIAKKDAEIEDLMRTSNKTLQTNQSHLAADKGNAATFSKVEIKSKRSQN